jgi:hypothetical protein
VAHRTPHTAYARRCHFTVRCGGRTSYAPSSSSAHDICHASGARRTGRLLPRGGPRHPVTGPPFSRPPPGRRSSRRSGQRSGRRSGRVSASARSRRSRCGPTVYFGSRADARSAAKMPNLVSADAATSAAPDSAASVRRAQGGSVRSPRPRFTRQPRPAHPPHVPTVWVRGAAADRRSRPPPVSARPLPLTGTTRRSPRYSGRPAAGRCLRSPAAGSHNDWPAPMSRPRSRHHRPTGGSPLCRSP